MCNCNNNISISLPDNKEFIMPTVGQIGKGMLGIGKVLLNIDVLPPQDIINRRNICYACDKKTTLNQCSLCACYIAYKIKLSKESCPLNKW